MSVLLRTSSMLCFFFMVSILMGQESAYEHFRAEREVPFSTVYGKIVQDSLGYMWLGTGRGLYRFDGKQFSYFPAEDKIVDEEILFFGFLGNGTLWAENFSRQLCYLLPGTDTLRLFEFPDSIKGEFKGISKISETEIHINAKDNTRKTLIYILSFPEGAKNAYKIAVRRLDSSHEIELDPSQKRFFLKGSKDLVPPILSCAVIEEDSIIEIAKIRVNKPLLVGPEFIYLPYLNKVVLDPATNTNLPIYLFDATAPYRYDVIPNNDIIRVNLIIDDQHKNIWICTDNGIIGYDQHLRPLLNGQKLLSGRVINTMFQDDEGGYWIGTEKDGLYYIPDLNVKYYNTFNSSLPNDNITVLTNGADQILYGGTQSSHLFKIQAEEIKNLYNFTLKQLNNVDIRGIEYLNDYLYIALNDHKHFQYHPETKQLKSFSIKGAGKTIGTYKDQILFGSNGGSYLLAPDSSNIVVQQFSQERSNSILGDTAAQRVWISDKSGFQYYDFKLDRLIKFSLDKQVIPRIGLDLAKDRNGTIWMASANEGIYGFHSDTLRYHFSADNGLLSNNCREIITDQQHLWIATNRGINRINLETLDIQVIDRADGLLIENIMNIAIADDKLWAGTTDGLFSIPLKENYTRFSSPKIHISQVKIWEQEVPLRKSYTLPFHQNNFYIEFQGIHFQSKEKMSYQYRMVDIDSNWITLPSTINFVRYPQLRPGNYHFEVKAISSEGISNAPAHLDIEIKPAFWQSWWFWILALLIIVGITQWLIAGIRKRKAKEELYLRRIEQLRSVALRSQMNPHFIFNTLNAILFFLSKNDWKSSVKYLSKFSKLIRHIFDYSKYDKITLSEEIQFLENYLELENLRFADRVMIRKHIDSHLRNSSIMVPPLLIQPLIENAFKHGLFHRGAGGVLQFSIREQENSIYILIEDNGIGREKAGAINKKRNKIKKNSSGKVLQERIDMINSRYPKNQPKITVNISDLTNPEGLANGTRCEFFIYF